MTKKGLHVTKDMYKFFKKNHPDTDITYFQFRYITGLFNKKVVERVLKGEEVKVKNLGSFSIRRVERNFDTKKVNFNETNKLKKQGINKIVYWTDKFYYRWHWSKIGCKLKNKTVYSFKLSNGPNGNKRKISTLLQNDDLAYLNFRNNYNEKNIK